MTHSFPNRRSSGRGRPRAGDVGEGEYDAVDLAGLVTDRLGAQRQPEGRAPDPLDAHDQPDGRLAGAERGRYGMALARPRAAVLTQGPPDRVAVVDAAADVVFELEDELRGRGELDDALVAVVEEQPLWQRV